MEAGRTLLLNENSEKECLLRKDGASHLLGTENKSDRNYNAFVHILTVTTLRGPLLLTVVFVTLFRKLTIAIGFPHHRGAVGSLPHLFAQ